MGDDVQRRKNFFESTGTFFFQWLSERGINLQGLNFLTRPVRVDINFIHF